MGGPFSIPKIKLPLTWRILIFEIVLEWDPPPLSCNQRNTVFFLFHQENIVGTHYTPGIRSMLRGYIVFFFSVSVCLRVNIYSVSKISQELLYLESWNLVHMTSMTSCIVGKKIGAVGSDHLELFPFVVLAICKCQNIETMLSLMAMAGY